MGGPVVWNNAQQLCSEDNGQLAMVKDAQTDAALRSIHHIQVMVTFVCFRLYYFARAAKCLHWVARQNQYRNIHVARR